MIEAGQKGGMHKTLRFSIFFRGCNQPNPSTFRMQI